MSHVGLWEKRAPSRRKSKCKGPETEPWSNKEANGAGVEAAGTGEEPAEAAEAERDFGVHSVSAEEAQK